LAWLFKIRGGFLEYALQPRTSSLRAQGADPNSSGGNLHSAAVTPTGAANASFSVRVRSGRQAALANEDQFRSAFEIADTNGDGVLSYQEAIEVRCC
jgi:hypothetical protein